MTLPEEQSKIDLGIPDAATDTGAPKEVLETASFTIDSRLADTSSISDANVVADEIPGKAPQKIVVPPSIPNLIVSSALSLTMVLVLLVCLRYLLPPMLEGARYSWYRGQLRAEYESAGHQLERVSWQGLTDVSKAVSRRVGPSVVHITLKPKQEVGGEKNASESLDREIRRKLQNPFGTKADPRSLGQGSGIVVDNDGYILTNYHVIENGGEVQVCIADERCFKATVVGIDRMTDLALLRIECDGLMPIVWGDSDEMDVGSPVWAVGSPFGLMGSVCFGIVSGKHRQDLKAGSSSQDTGERKFSRYRDLMQSDVAVNPGNSGGPLVNSKGELIGVNTAIIGESFQGVSFSIPSNFAKRIYEQLKAAGSVQRGWLGVELVQSDTNFDGGVVRHGALIRNIYVGSPAHRHDLRVGDVILALNEVNFRTIEELIYRIGCSRVGSTVSLTVLREDAEIDIEIELGERPTENE